LGEKREKKEKEKRKTHQRQTGPQPDTCAAPTGKEHGVTSNDMSKLHFWML